MNENPYHKNRKIIRLQTWDYRWAGSYFITICTQNREHYFGEIIDGKMQLSHIGVIADIFWHEIKNRAKNVELGEFIVMPNHVHGILILKDNNVEIDNSDINNVGTGHALSRIDNSDIDNSDIDNVGTGHALSQQALSQNILSQNTLSQNHQSIGQKRFQNIGKNSISSIIGGYKSAVTKHANRLGFEFGWQTRFHDHIIRDEKAFNTISAYILHNPQKWEADKFYQKTE